MAEPRALIARMLPLSGITIGYIGHFDPGYARNRTLMKALRRAGATVIPISDQRRFPRRAPRLARTVATTGVDALVTGFPGHTDVGTAKLAAAFRSVPIVFSTLTSLWETSADRHGTRRNSVAGFRRRLTDWLSCSLADAIWLDTRSHIDWFAREFGIPDTKFRRVWVGADDDVMRPAPRAPAEPFTVFFYGTFIPLQGIEHIVEAASLVGAQRDGIRFVLCGDGQTFAQVQALVNRSPRANVTFLPRRPPLALSQLIAQSDVCLGIFGTGEKTQHVIPNKVFDALACARPVITADTPAARESLVDGRHAWLCPAGNPDALAAAIVKASEDDAGREAVARSGHELFRRRFSIDAISRDIAPLIHEVLGSANPATAGDHPSPVSP